ncbi:Rossmann-like and DUF2520 domain-containing protein [Arcticibacter tournemirensis]|nr:Rossmann-like and DUF2520 domain-containing protein [Arcticibacter tournemirensis]
MMKVILIGSGNVATHLGGALKAAGHDILQVWSRNANHASALASLLSAVPIDNLDDLNDNGDIYILSVADDAIADMASDFPFKDKLLVHTSGTTELDAIKSGSSLTGVFYPLQTFSKQKPIDFRNIPIVVEGSSESISSLLLSLASDISDKTEVVNSEKRRVLHLAAVFACNFSNHLYAIAGEILAEQQLNFDLIRPLIAETAAKAQVYAPSQVQTGPAARKDFGTMERHLLYLENKQEWYKIYKVLSESIVNNTQ